MYGDVMAWLREPLVVLSGTPVSVMSLITAILIVIAARILVGLLARSLARIFVARGIESGVGFAITKIVRWLAMVIGVLIAMTTIGLDLGAVFAVGAVLVVGIGFGLQKLAENFISGLLLLVERPVRVGDFVAVDQLKGTIVDIGLRITRVQTRDGITHLIPNGELVNKPVTNYTTASPKIRIWLDIGVAYDSDLVQVREVLLAVAAAEPLVIADPAPEIRHKGFGDNAINLALVAWIGNADDDDEATSALNFAVGDAFAARGIEIPFPQREVRLRREFAPPAARQ